MKQVFISYTTHDLQRASAIRKMLEEHDISCWMGDKDIHASNTYTADITKAIEQCQVFVLVLSSYSQESSYVHSEFECAIAKHKPIIPFIIENFRIKEEFNFHIRQRQAIAAFEDWKEGMEKLLDTAKFHLSKNKKAEIQQLAVQAQSNVQISDTPVSAENVILCPFCGCPVLKRRRLFVDRFLYPKEGVLHEEAFKMLLLRERNNVLGGSMIISMILSLISIIRFICNLEKTAGIIVINGICVVLCVLITIVFGTWTETNDVIKELIDAINASKQKYWTFKCVDCEKCFSILLPKEDDINIRVPGLLKKISKDKTN